jgi:hypothetical protein
MRSRFALTLIAGYALAYAAENNPALTRSAADYVPALPPLTRPSASAARELVERYTADRAEIDRLQAVKGSTQHRRRLGEFLAAWRKQLEQIETAALDVEGAIDVSLLRTRVVHEQRLLEREAARQTEMAPWLPFADALIALPEARRNLTAVDGRAAAEALESVRKVVEPLGKSLEEKLKAGQGPSKVVALRAAGRLSELQRALTEWFDTYNGYDPEFGWWVRDPFKQVTLALEAYGKVLREKGAGIDPKQRDEPIVGDPIGRAGLVEELAKELVAYTPEELIALAEREFAWVDHELRRAAAEMGLGDDWKAALERVKRDHVAPGQQPALVRDLALEAERYVRERDLVTVPPLAADVWLIKMMPPAQQKVAPFFSGGSDILVAFPTDEMTHEEKVQSLRANNRHFARATVFHEFSSRASSAVLGEAAAQSAPRVVHDAVLDGGLGLVVGAAAVGSRLLQHPRGPHWDALLAGASLRADHLLARVSPGRVDAAAVCGLPRRPDWSRASECHGRGAAFVQRPVVAALSGWVPVGCAADSHALSRIRDLRSHGREGVSRRHSPRRSDADRDGPRPPQRDQAGDRLPRNLAICGVIGIFLEPRNTRRTRIRANTPQG